MINPDDKNTLGTEAAKRRDGDYRVEWFSGTGCGGQYRNKHQNSCRLIHIPTGIEKVAQTRSRTSSLDQAQKALDTILDNMEKKQLSDRQASIRKEQVGSGERGDKIRTYRFQDNVVTDHGTGRTAPCDQVMKGKFNLLWNK